MIADDAQFVTEFSERATDEPALVIDVEGFEGPLDLLLRWRASRKSISPKSRSWRLPTSTSRSSKKRASCGWRSPPIIW